MSTDELNEQSYMQGRRAAYTAMLHECVRALGYEEEPQVAWIEERESAVAQLRELCEQFGDNDWDESLHLADVIEKHLSRYLFEGSD